MVEKANDYTSEWDNEKIKRGEQKKLRANVREVREETSDCNESVGEILRETMKKKNYCENASLNECFKWENKTRERERKTKFYYQVD